MAFAAPCIAFAASQENDFGFSTINRLIVIPLFLFSGSFFPVTQLPKALQVLALATPLYHGVALARSATLGHLLQLPTVGHLAYLIVVTALSIVVCRRNFERRLAP